MTNRYEIANFVHVDMFNCQTKILSKLILRYDEDDEDVENDDVHDPDYNNMNYYFNDSKNGFIVFNSESYIFD